MLSLIVAQSDVRMTITIVVYNQSYNLRHTNPYYIVDHKIDCISLGIP